MAIQAKVSTLFGEDRVLYIRLNNVEASNHGEDTLVKFRGFLSKEAFEAGSHFLWEKDISFPADIAEPLWPQAYAYLIEHSLMTEVTHMDW